MNIEQELCKAIVGVFQDVLNGVEIHGNWIQDDDIKGVDVYAGRRIDVNVGARKHDGYSSPMAEISVTIEGELAAEEDVSLEDTVEAYEAVVCKLEEWHHDIAAVKRDLTLTNQLADRAARDPYQAGSSGSDTTGRSGNAPYQEGSDTTTTIFVPVGLKVDGGPPIEIDRETKMRRFSQQFTIKGRII